MMILADEQRKIMSEIYIGYPYKKGSGCGPSSAQKKQPTFLHIKHDYPYIFQRNNSFCSTM